MKHDGFSLVKTPESAGQNCSAAPNSSDQEERLMQLELQLDPQVCEQHSLLGLQRKSPVSNTSGRKKGRTLNFQFSAHTTNISHQQSELRCLLKLAQQVLKMDKGLVSE